MSIFVDTKGNEKIDKMSAAHRSRTRATNLLFNSVGAMLQTRINVLINKYFI